MDGGVHGPLVLCSLGVAHIGRQPGQRGQRLRRRASVPDVDPARDLFADVTYGALPGSLEAWGHWLWFFALLILIWAFPPIMRRGGSCTRTRGCSRAASARRSIPSRPRTSGTPSRGSSTGFRASLRSCRSSRFWSASGRPIASSPRPWRSPRPGRLPRKSGRCFGSTCCLPRPFSHFWSGGGSGPGKCRRRSGTASLLSISRSSRSYFSPPSSGRSFPPTSPRAPRSCP